MTSISTATAGWLALRAPADDAARSPELAHELARMLTAASAPVVLHDLGAGTGSMTRWLAPRLPGPQRWVLRDGDADIVEHLDLGAVTDAGGRPIEADVVVEDLAELPIDAFHDASAVTASALLDVITRAEAAHIVAACVAAGTPALFSLTVTGAVRLRPAEAHGEVERALGAAFDDHQRRDVDGRRMLGPDAVAVTAGLFADAGWHVRRAATPWRLRRRDSALVAEWLDGWVDAAVEWRPELAEDAEAYRGRRQAQAAAGRLRVTVSHEDLLAWPG
ncbi:class I SAM-dependent methyltransferase [Microbacterium sp. QXD-8]|uniref:Class I SAM-dependent methyltransferase n=1 Tax=Microbacterium psychrotolerans TaxID=3068321 RepID=A0ABU0Z6J2_9MICO|nr:class I SAM-dependent methyltransferase [Microbacterium sp. QXD-8]MDQ7879570.1 class I SAM-dependent methyltransferase [Microbacterium sp. QXD-8]